MTLGQINPYPLQGGVMGWEAWLFCVDFDILFNSY